MNTDSDKYLVRRLRQDDRKSFEKLFEKYYDKFFSFACALLRNENIAEDILQNVFLKLWIGRKNLDEDRSLENYLLVSIRNEIFNYLRLKHNKVIVRGEMPEKEDRSADVEAKVEYDEFSGRMEKIILRMPQQRQKVFIMSRYKQMTIREIADATGLSERTVERHISLALKDIRTLLS